MTNREEAVYVAYTSVIEGNQAGFSLEVQPGGAAAGPREGCMLTCLQLPAQPAFFLNPEPSARGRYHPVGWTLDFSHSSRSCFFPGLPLDHLMEAFSYLRVVQTTQLVSSR